MEDVKIARGSNVTVQLSPELPQPVVENTKKNNKRRSSRRLLYLLVVPIAIIAFLFGGVYLTRSAPPQQQGSTGSNTVPGLSFFQHTDQPTSCATSANSTCGTPIGLTFQRHTGTAGPMTTFTPGLLGSGTELSDPMRGPQYYGSETPPPGWPLTDRYNRWCWSEIEPQQGQYNFGLIDDHLATAAAAGYSFGFRIMPINPGSSCLPDYMSGVDVNDPVYLQRARALFNALGQRYNNDPRLGFMDMSLYGCWGEWNESCGGTVMSAANRKALIDLELQALPNKQFFMLTDKQDSLDYALTLKRAKPVGVRIDCLGYEGLGGGAWTFSVDSIALNQWHIAPLYFEYCNGPKFPLALSDIQTYHASMIGDGSNNIDSFGNYSSTDQANMLQNYRVSGYRFVLNSISIASTIPAGSKFSVSSHWSNQNVAPAYHAWNVMIQLRDGSGKVAWQDTSALNLRQLFSGKPLTVNDQFTLPSNVTPGTYTVSVQVMDGEHYYHPMQLAIQGRQNDGSYSLGTVTVTA